MSQTKEKEEFREEQRAAARSQNLTSENAVPEQRPQASQEVTDYHQSDTYKKLRDSGELNDEPMDKDAYDRADSAAQLKKAQKKERSPDIGVGAKVIITKGPYEGQTAVVNEVRYASVEDERIKAAGTPESRFAKVDALLVRTRGGRHALLSLDPKHVRLAASHEWGRREA